MREIERLLNEAEANGAGFPDLRARVLAVYRHYEVAQGIISAYLGMPAVPNPPDAENRQREIDASAAAWLETVVL